MFLSLVFWFQRMLDKQHSPEAGYLQPIARHIQWDIIFLNAALSQQHGLGGPQPEGKHFWDGL